jgi:dipeptidase E
VQVGHPGNVLATVDLVRLYLSSLYVGDRAEDLVRQVGAGGRVAVVANAMDADPDRTAGVRRELRELAGLGLDPTELDLRAHDEHSLTAELAGYAGLWVRGGNTFLLREAMARSALDEVLPGLLERDEIAYAGWSAGACVLAPTLRGIELCDDPAEVKRLWGTPARYDGLDVVEVVVVPHVGTDPCADETIRRYDADGTPYLPLCDGEVVVVDGDGPAVSLQL